MTVSCMFITFYVVLVNALPVLHIL